MTQASIPTDPVALIHRLQIEARDRDALLMFTVYDHPLDFPDSFVARCFAMSRGAEPVPTAHVIRGKSLTVLRMVLRYAGLTPLARNDGDDPKIVETWL